jgi:hypothetical protein
MILFFGGLPFVLLCFSVELPLALFPFGKYVMRVALYLAKKKKMAPRLAALAVAHLCGSQTVPWLLVLRLLAFAELCSTGPAYPA